jgi:hypothetical protein
MKKDLISKLLPLVSKVKGQKPIVLILSVVVIGACIFAIQKGHIAEGSIDFGNIIDQISGIFGDNVDVVVPTDSIPVDNIMVPVDSVTFGTVDSIAHQ